MRPSARNGAAAGRYTLDYRPEIDGLRAWAVVLVVLFHAKIDGFGGGFVGVDVFFVISGFLITRLIADEAERGQFSIVDFYARRVRRIIPALAVMVALTMAAGAVVMLPGSLQRLSESGIAAMLFSSNVYFWRTSASYFSAPAELNPLLHTWSLAVEEQFYLFFPPLLILLFRRSPRLLIPACAVIAAATLVLAEYGNAIAPTATFFLSPTRAWEFLAGALLALNAVPPVRARWLGVAMVTAGLALVVASGLLLRADMGFPGMLAIPPVLGTAMIIHGAPAGRGTPASLLFTWRPVLYTGLISYSLYLWHWPVLVFAEHYVLRRPLAAAETAGLIGMAAALAVLSYHLVEEPFRRGGLWRRRRALFTAGGSMIAVTVALGAAGAATDGLAFRYPGMADFAITPQRKAEAPLVEASRQACVTPPFGGRTSACVLAGPGPRNVLVWGDSHAGHHAAALAEVGEVAEGRGIYSIATPQCPPVIGYDPVNVPSCAPANRWAVDQIARRDVDTVVLAAKWYSYAASNRLRIQNITATVRMLKDLELRVVVVGQSPMFHFSEPQEHVYGHFLQGGDVQLVTAKNTVPPQFNATLEVALRSAGVDAFLDPGPLFCSAGECRYYQEGKYLFRDIGHFTLEGSRTLVRSLIETLEDLPERQAQNG